MHTNCHQMLLKMFLLANYNYKNCANAHFMQLLKGIYPIEIKALNQ